MAACGRGAAGKRNSAMITLAWKTGLRLDETLSLRPGDVNMAERHIYIRHGKGDKPRRLGLPSAAWSAVRVWMTERTKLGLTGRHLLFCTFTTGTDSNGNAIKAGAKIEQSYVRSLMSRLRRRAGLSKRLHFHGLRHSFAWDRSREHTPLPELYRPIVVVRPLSYSPTAIARALPRAIVCCSPSATSGFKDGSAANPAADAGDAVEEIRHAVCDPLVGSLCGSEEGPVGAARRINLFHQDGEWRIPRLS